MKGSMDQFIDTHDTKSRLINYSFNLFCWSPKKQFLPFKQTPTERIKTVY